MSLDDVVLNKAAIIERCVRRIREEYTADQELRNVTRVDALTLNIERACQAAIDVSMHMVAKQHLGVPQSSAAAFQLLADANILAESLAQSLRGMTGFRNIAVHEYQQLDPSVLHWIARDGWRDWVKLCEALGVHISVE